MISVGMLATEAATYNYDFWKTSFLPRKDFPIKIPITEKTSLTAEANRNHGAEPKKTEPLIRR